MGISRFCVLLASAGLLARSSPLQRRQAEAPDAGTYIKQVNTALYAINSIQAGNESTACSDPQLPADLDASGYDGQYAKKLLCEVASGVQVFPDIDQAAADMSIVVSGLDEVQSPSNGLPRVPSCETVNVQTLNEAGLDGTAIQDFICRASSPAEVTANLSSGAISVTSNSTTSEAVHAFTNTGEPRSPLFPTSSLATFGEPAATGSRVVLSSVAPTTPSTSELSIASTVPPTFVLSTLEIAPTGVAPSSSAPRPLNNVSVITVFSASATPSVPLIIATAPHPPAGPGNVSLATLLSSGASSSASLTTGPLPTGISMVTVNGATSPVIIATTYNYTTFVVGSPLHAASSTGSSSSEGTATKELTTSTIYVTVPVNATQTYPIATEPHGPWHWTGPWGHGPGYAWPRPTAWEGGPQPSSTGVVTAYDPYAAAQTAWQPEENCTDGW